MFIVIGSGGLILALLKWFLTGEDIPGGILTLLSSIIAAVFVPEGIAQAKKVAEMHKQKEQEEETDGARNNTDNTNDN